MPYLRRPTVYLREKLLREDVAVAFLPWGRGLIPVAPKGAIAHEVWVESEPALLHSSACPSSGEAVVTVPPLYGQVRPPAVAR